jgi:hypothetical protein
MVDQSQGTAQLQARHPLDCEERSSYTYTCSGQLSQRSYCHQDQCKTIASFLNHFLAKDGHMIELLIDELLSVTAGRFM